MTDFYESKNILVAGGAGFVGTNLVQQLIKLNANVTSTYYLNKPQNNLSLKYKM